MNILDAYITKAPSPQNIFDMFSCQWSSLLPASKKLLTALGHAA